MTFQEAMDKLGARIGFRLVARIYADTFTFKGFMQKLEKIELSFSDWKIVGEELKMIAPKIVRTKEEKRHLMGFIRSKKWETANKISDWLMAGGINRDLRDYENHGGRDKEGHYHDNLKSEEEKVQIVKAMLRLALSADDYCFVWEVAREFKLEAYHRQAFKMISEIVKEDEEWWELISRHRGLACLALDEMVKSERSLEGWQKIMSYVDGRKKYISSYEYWEELYEPVRQMALDKMIPLLKTESEIISAIREFGISKEVMEQKIDETARDLKFWVDLSRSFYWWHDATRRKYRDLCLEKIKQQAKSIGDLLYVAENSDEEIAAFAEEELSEFVLGLRA